MDNGSTGQLGEFKQDQFSALFVCLIRIPTQLWNDRVSRRATGDRVWLDGESKAAEVAHRKARDEGASDDCGINTSEAVFRLSEACPQDRQTSVVVTVGAECFVEHRKRGRCVVEPLR